MNDESLIDIAARLERDGTVPMYMLVSPAARLEMYRGVVAEIERAKRNHKPVKFLRRLAAVLEGDW